MPTRLTQIERKKLALTMGATMRSARNRIGLTQKEPARQVGVATEVYGRFERGRLLPSVGMIVALCRALHANPSEILGFAVFSEGMKKPAPLSSLAEGLPDMRESRRLLRALRHARPAQVRLVAKLVDHLVGSS